MENLSLQIKLSYIPNFSTFSHFISENKNLFIKNSEIGSLIYVVDMVIHSFHRKASGSEIFKRLKFNQSQINCSQISCLIFETFKRLETLINLKMLLEGKEVRQ